MFEDGLGLKTGWGFIVR